jgi:UDP-N-acetyl-D-mannosaminuronate dehydrogenase
VPELDEAGLTMRSVDLGGEAVEQADIVCVVTAHGGIDYEDLARRAQLVLDFRNAVPRAETVEVL